MKELPHENDLEAHYFGATSEVVLSAYFSLFLVLLLLAVLLSNKVAHHWHSQYVPEAAAVIALGIAAGIGCRLWSGMIAKTLMMFDAKTFFVVLLPPIIFNSGYTMKRRFFLENIRSILSFAIVGTFVSNVLVGLLLFAAGRLGISVRLSVAECLTFGALISATDPVSTLAIFQELHVDPTLFYIVFGESVLNDAVGIVLFTTFSKFIGFTYTASSTIFALLDFALIFVGSTLVGILFGLLSALLFKYFDFKKWSFTHICSIGSGWTLDVVTQVGAYILFSYLPFLVSTAVDMSGVVSILFTGITMKHYTHNNISPEAQDICSHIFSSLAHLTETVVFLNLGLTLFSVTSGYHFGLIFCSMLFCFIGRAAHVYPISRVLNKSLPEPLTMNQQHMLWFSGLRGAVAYALASSFPGEHRDYIVATTMVIVLLTVFFMGGGTVSMLDRLQITRLTPEQEAALDRSVRPVDRMKLLQHDSKYLVPFFTKQHSNKIFSFGRSDEVTDEGGDNDEPKSTKGISIADIVATD